MKIRGGWGIVMKFGFKQGRAVLGLQNMLRYAKNPPQFKNAVNSDEVASINAAGRCILATVDGTRTPFVFYPPV